MSMIRTLAGGAFVLVLLAAAPASAQSGTPTLSYGESATEDDAPVSTRRERRRPSAEVHPYVEANAGVSADLSGGDDEVLTYTSVAAGVDARVATRRVTVQASYRYERRFEIEGDLPDNEVHSGVAGVHAAVAPGVSLDAAALATRTGGAGEPTALSQQVPTAQLYSVVGGPTVNAHAGPVAIGAAYRIGYVRVEQGDELAGAPLADGYEAVGHNATASIGMAPGRAPIGWTVGAGYTRSDESGDFENRFEAAYVRGDVVLPVGPTLALTAGVGYERTDASQIDVLRNSAGVPILVDGRPVPDPTGRRVDALDRSGIFYDGGFIWRPTPRTELQARAGHRHGGITVVGSLTHRFRRGYGLSASVYDSVGTFGTSVMGDLARLPREFGVNRNPQTGAIEGCVFGTDPGTGICFDQALQGLSNRTFRSRGGTLAFSGGRGPWSFGLGGGYAHRRYYELESGNFDSLTPQSDESYYFNARIDRRSGRFSGLGLNVTVGSHSGAGIDASGGLSTGVGTSYYWSLIHGLQIRAALGLTYTNGLLLDEDALIASALLGLRYTF